MSWLRSLIRRLLGHTRHHEIANRTQERRLRQELLSKQLDVYRRGR
jgi:hypothetical protein